MNKQPINFDYKAVVLPIVNPEGRISLETIKQYKCQVIMCWRRANSSFDFEGETQAYLVCRDHLIKIATGDWETFLFLSKVVWKYSDWLLVWGFVL